MTEAALYEKLENRKIRCLSCSWKCLLADKSFGICGVRFNEDGKLYLAVYGQAIGMHLDPIEKKPLYHFLPGTQFLSFGTLGCNFACSFCQNWEQSQTPRDLVKEDTFAERKKHLLQLIKNTSQPFSPQEIVKLALELGAPAIAYTYNEPAIFAEYAHDTAKLTKERGLRNVYVSNGFESVEGLNYIAPFLDAINIDLKSFNPSFYQKICRARLQPVLETIKRVHEKGIHVEITTLIIPNLNDSAKELEDIAQFIADVDADIPWHVTAFHPSYQLLNQPPTPVEKLEQAWQIGKEAGLNYVYVGNVSGNERNHTFCPQCNALLVERFGYEVRLRNFDAVRGVCKHCQMKIGGIWGMLDKKLTSKRAIVIE